MSHRPGPLNLITDVPGLLVGNAEDEDAATGTTVVLCGDGWPAGVDVRGGGPGLRETEVLSAENLVGRAHAFVLGGGTVFGLAAADGVAVLLSTRGVGIRLRSGAPAIPIVPSAVLHDLGNGGNKDWGMFPPYRELGIRAAQAAGAEFELGRRGAGRGAMAALIRGGLGSASIDLNDGVVVGALVAANPVGSALMPDGRTYWAWPFEIGGEFGGHRPSGDIEASDPAPNECRLAQLGRLQPGANTTIAVVGTSAALTTAECKRLAMMAQDGIARAIRPAHTLFDGDTVFAVSSDAVPLSTRQDRAVQLARIGSAAADCLARAVARGVYEANRDHQAASGSRGVAASSSAV